MTDWSHGVGQGQRRAAFPGGSLRGEVDDPGAARAPPPPPSNSSNSSSNNDNNNNLESVMVAASLTEADLI